MSYIIDLQVSLNADDERKYRTAGYSSVPGDLNSGTGGPKTYLWYKKGSDKNAAITRIQFAFDEISHLYHEQVSESLKIANYKKINKKINEGTSGDPIYLWYFNGSTKYDFPIIDLHVTTHADEEPDMFRLGWKRLACDLNRNAGGNRIHLWVMQKEETYISDITATLNCGEDASNFNLGYIRLDEDTNRGVEAAPYIFIFYRLTKLSSEAVNDVQISTNKDSSQNIFDLNQGTGGPPVYLWYSKMTSNPPIQDLTLILNSELSEYKKAKIPVIDQTINPKGDHMYVSYYSEPESCCGDRAEHAH